MAMADENETTESGGSRLPTGEDADYSTIPVTGELWKHYKGKLYEVVIYGRDEKTGNLQVVYREVQDHMGTKRVLRGIPWIRPLTEWTEEVEPGVQRFTKVKE
jgi:hypothetical protein